MRTCPACGKENADDVKRCATCDEELEAVAEAAPPEAEPAEPSVRELHAPDTNKTEDAHERALAAMLAAEAAPVEPDKPAGEPVPHEGHEGSGAPPAVVRASPTVAMQELVPEAVPAADTAAAGPIPLDGNKSATATLVPGNVKLVVEQGLSVNKEYLLNDPELVVGRRDPEQEFIPDIDLFDQENANNRYVSRRQARLFFKNGRLYVEDLDSSNGTVVNNRPIKPNIEVELHPGDKLLFGQSVMFRIRALAQ